MHTAAPSAGRLPPPACTTHCVPVPCIMHAWGAGRNGVSHMPRNACMCTPVCTQVVLLPNLGLTAPRPAPDVMQPLYLPHTSPLQVGYGLWVCARGQHCWASQPGEAGPSRPRPGGPSHWPGSQLVAGLACSTPVHPFTRSPLPPPPRPVCAQHGRRGGRLLAGPAGPVAGPRGRAAVRLPHAGPGGGSGRGRCGGAAGEAAGCLQGGCEPLTGGPGGGGRGKGEGGKGGVVGGSLDGVVSVGGWGGREGQQHLGGVCHCVSVRGSVAARHVPCMYCPSSSWHLLTPPPTTRTPLPRPHAPKPHTASHHQAAGAKAATLRPDELSALFPSLRLQGGGLVGMVQVRSLVNGVGGGGGREGGGAAMRWECPPGCCRAAKGPAWSDTQHTTSGALPPPARSSARPLTVLALDGLGML